MKELNEWETLQAIVNGEPSSIVKNLAAVGVTLPKFIRDNLPVGETYTIARQGEGFVVVETAIHYESVRDAYKATRGLWNVISFDESVRDTVLKDSIFGYYEENQNGERTLFSAGFDAETHYVEEYVEFLIAASKYRENPNDLARAWSFIERHPAFWLKKGTRDNKAFATDEGAGLIEFCIYPDEENGNATKVALEMGGHDATNNYETRYLDVLLIATAGSIDAAVIILAQKIEQYYDYEGNSTPEADKERSEYFERKGWNRK